MVSKYVIVVVISKADIIVANYILDIHLSRALLLIVAVGYIHGDKKSISLIHNYCLLLLLELKMPKLMTEVPLLQVCLNVLLAIALFSYFAKLITFGASWDLIIIHGQRATSNSNNVCSW